MTLGVTSSSAFTRSNGFQVLVGVLAVVLPTLGRLLLDPLLEDEAPYLLHLAAVGAATWIAGGRAGAIALVGGTLGVQWLFLSPRGEFLPSRVPTIAGELLFLFVGAATVWLVSRTRRAERRITGLLHAATESIWLFGRDGTVLVANAVAASKVNRTIEDVQGRKWQSLIEPEAAARREVHVQRVLETGQPVRFEDERNGQQFDHHFCPVFDDRGSVAAVAVFSRDVTQQKRAMEELRELSQRLTYHVDQSPLAVIEWGSDMRLTRWSAEAERVFGWRADEVLGKRMEDFRWVYEEDAGRVQAVSADLRTGLDPQRFSLNRNYRKDGAVVWCEWYNSSLLDESGRMKSILSLVLDVTARRMLEEQLRATAAELARANRLKDEFLATLSHELRTPLHAIVGWSSMLLSGRLPPDRVPHGLEVIARNARAQAQLIEETLDMSRIITGKLQLSLEPVNLPAVLAPALESMRPAADAKGVAVESHLEDVTLSADAARLQQIVWNLVSNAVKFTPPGGRVRVRATSCDEHLEIVVEDTGIGIAPEFLPRVFDRFSQADASTTRQHGGLGLGLAIVRHVAELHGGSVSASSLGPGHGATFTVRLPLNGGPRAGESLRASADR
jgi:PAS domain S-box-containing protein